jgi:uncharacterized protein YegL
MNLSVTPEEAPPAYTPGPPQPANKKTVQPIYTSTDDDPYAFLRSFDTVFLIDDSGSMAGRSWQETSKALQTITPICTERDEDGIDIYFLNHPDETLYKNITTSETVVEIFQTIRPDGVTPTGKRLSQILKPYLKRYKKKPDSTKPINIIVITDGEPTDDVESSIIQAAKKLDELEALPWQIGIQFFQVGNVPGVGEHLEQLDKGLGVLADNGELRDMVATVPFTGENGGELTAAGILKAVLGAVVKRYDRWTEGLHGEA